MKILQIHLKAINYSANVSVEKLVNSTDGFSGADLRALILNAHFEAERERKTLVEMHHFERILLAEIKQRNMKLLKKKKKSYYYDEKIAFDYII